MAFPRAHDRIIQGTPRDLRSRRVALRRPERRAFSMVELVIVVLIIAACAAIAIPRFADAAARARVLAAADRLGAEIILTKDRARAASAPCTLRIVRGSGAVKVLDADASVIASADLGMEPYLATVVRTDLPGGQVEFTAFALPTASGRILLRSAGQLAIVSIESDGTVMVSAATPAQAPDPVLTDVVTQLGDNLSIREIAVTPGNTIATTVAKVEGK